MSRNVLRDYAFLVACHYMRPFRYENAPGSFITNQCTSSMIGPGKSISVFNHRCGNASLLNKGETQGEREESFWFSAAFFLLYNSLTCNDILASSGCFQMMVVMSTKVEAIGFTIDLSLSSALRTQMSQ